MTCETYEGKLLISETYANNWDTQNEMNQYISRTIGYHNKNRWIYILLETEYEK